MMERGVTGLRTWILGEKNVALFTFSDIVKEQFCHPTNVDQNAEPYKFLFIVAFSYFFFALILSCVLRSAIFTTVRETSADTNSPKWRLVICMIHKMHVILRECTKVSHVDMILEVKHFQIYLYKLI